jgi:hypothetical protein
MASLITGLWNRQAPHDAKGATYEDDDIYPVHVLDGSKTLRGIVVTWTLCFNDVLDADKLRISLTKLLGMGDWRKVGGRLRLKVCYLSLS